MLLAFCLALLGIQHGIAQNLDESCEMFYTNIRGVCTLASKCPSARKEYRMNGIPPTICKNSGKKLLVCCKDSSTSLTIAAVDFKPASSRRVSERKCEEYSQIVDQTGDVKCRNSGVESLVGSKNANQGEFPHTAAIGWTGVDGSYVFSCGGSLISPRYVLTAGQCINNPATNELVPSIVRLGEQNLDPKVRDDANPVDIPIKAAHKHPLFMAPRKYDDIALIELSMDVKFTKDIRPACLWTKADFSDNVRAVASGWGVIISAVGDSCTVEHTNSRGKCTESSKCQTAKEDYQKNGVPLTFCYQSDTLTLVCCRDGITILDTEQNSDDKPELSKSVVSNQNTSLPLSEKEGDNCTVLQTNTRGVCKQASKCLSAVREYQYNRIVPTYCKHSDDFQLVCCKDGITILDTYEVEEKTPILTSPSTDENTTRKIIKKVTRQKYDDLKKTMFSLIENNECDKLVTPTRNLRNGVKDTQLCAVAPVDICQIDSGSPLQVSSEDRCILHIIGITASTFRSTRPNCPKSGTPQIYTRVSSYVDWIESIVWPSEQ